MVYREKEAESVRVVMLIVSAFTPTRRRRATGKLPVGSHSIYRLPIIYNHLLPVRTYLLLAAYGRQHRMGALHGRPFAKVQGSIFSRRSWSACPS